MKIELIMTVPVEDKHGLTKGRIMEAKLTNAKLANSGEIPYYWVIGDTGEKVGVHKHEAVPTREES